MNELGTSAIKRQVLPAYPSRPLPPSLLGDLVVILGVQISTGLSFATDLKKILPYHTELLMCGQERVIKMDLQVTATLVLTTDIPATANRSVVRVVLDQGFRVLMPIRPAAPRNLVVNHLAILRAREIGGRTETLGSA
jgi:hypothetical protein